MCGIVGCAAPATAGDILTAVERGTMRLSHRGPDGHSVTRLESGDHRTQVIFGHRRLAIIDRSEAGDQPMPNEDASVHCVFNGEIYNFPDLRGMLEQKGHKFRSRCDTEVIVHGYEEFGDSFVEQLDGMFAIALWDSRCSRLLLARDRAGKKPLYYSWNQGWLTFASETKALRGFPSVDVSVDWDLVPHYLARGYISGSRTLNRGVKQVPAGTTIVLDSEGLSAPRPYWDLTFSAGKGTSWDDAVQRFRELFDAAVAKRMIADVPLGALLSGGLDSSAVVAAMATRSSSVKTFCLGFEDAPTFDERRYARRVAQLFSTEHTEDVLRVDPAELLHDVVWHLDQPLADSSAVPTYLVSREARRHVTVVLNGDGGDEALGGYERFSAALAVQRLPRWLETGARSLARFLPRSDDYHDLKSRADRFLQNPDGTAVERYQGWLAVFDRELVRSITGRSVAEDPPVKSPDPLLHQLLYLNFKTYLHDDLLVKMDRMSMAHSLEARSPFLDTDLLQFVTSLPAEMKATIFQRKRLLKRAMKDLLPADLLARRKHGFGAPVDTWFRSSLVAPFRDLVLSRDSRVGERLDIRVVSMLMNQHETGTRSHGARLWSLLVLETWLRSLEHITITDSANALRPAADL